MNVAAAVPNGLYMCSFLHTAHTVVQRWRTDNGGMEMTRKRFMKLAMSGKPFAINRNQAIILARAANMCGLTYENAYMKLLRLADDIQKDVVRAYDRYTLASIQAGVKAQCVTIEIPVKEEK